MTDIINALAGISAGDRLDALRDHRPQAKENAQRSFEALLESEDVGSFPHRDRYAVAAFTAGLLGAPAAEEFYRDLLRDEDEAASWAVAELLDEAVLTLDSRAAVRGPYGVFESAALAAENVPGPWFTADPKSTETLGDRLVAGLEFAHLLALHPRDSRPGNLADSSMPAETRTRSSPSLSSYPSSASKSASAPVWPHSPMLRPPPMPRE